MGGRAGRLAGLPGGSGGGVRIRPASMVFSLAVSADFREPAIPEALRLSKSILT
jgi:hypothetical protein